MGKRKTKKLRKKAEAITIEITPPEEDADISAKENVIKEENEDEASDEDDGTEEDTEEEEEEV